MLAPKRTKYRKVQKGRMRGLSYRGSSLSFGEYGLKVVERGYLTSRQIEAARKSITGYTKRAGKLWIRVFPDKPITKKPAETRMGSGKGVFDHYVFVAKPGRIVFELSGVSEDIAKEAFKRAGSKLPMRSVFIKSGGQIV